MSAQILQFKPPGTVDEAWERYTALVQERHKKSLWSDLEHNKQIARAWDAWATLFNASERTQ